MRLNLGRHAHKHLLDMLPAPLAGRLAVEKRARAFRKDAGEMVASIDRLRAQGFAPKTIIDIGAFNGSWTYTMSGFFQDARFHMCEAQQSMVDHLSQVVAALDGRATYTMGLLGDAPRESVDFFVMGTGSSVLEEQTSFKRDCVSIPMTTLDTVVSQAKLTGPFFLKLDVQGFELEVLKGATRAVAQAEAILMEVALLEYNKGAPTIDDVIYAMAQINFVPFDISGARRRESDGALFQVDIIFVRRDSNLRAHRKFWNTE
jgi:FkbM family methyltransferase